MKTANRVYNIVTQDYDASSYSFVLEQFAKEVDQDWDNETTTYSFDDGSKITDNNGNLDWSV